MSMIPALLFYGISISFFKCQCSGVGWRGGEMYIHAGEKVKEYLEASGMSISEFARRLNCNRQNVYDILKRKDIDLPRLRQISKILGHDLVTELYAMRKPSKVTFKFAVTVEMDNGQCKVTDVQTIK